MMFLTLNVDPSLGPFTVHVSLVKHLKSFLLTSVFNVHVWSSGESRGGLSWVGLRVRGRSRGGMVWRRSQRLALLQALCHLHGRVRCCCRRLSAEKGCGSLRLVPLDFFACGIERDAHDEECITLTGFSIFI